MKCLNLHVLIRLSRYGLHVLFCDLVSVICIVVFIWTVVHLFLYICMPYVDSSFLCFDVQTQDKVYDTYWFTQILCWVWILDPPTFFSLNLATIDNQLLNKDVSWRGARKKDSKSIELLIEALTKLRVVVLDAYASTGTTTMALHSWIFDCMCLNLVQFANGWFSLWFLGASIHACKLSGRHLVALEGDANIFEAIIASLCEANPPMMCGRVPKTTSLSDENAHVWKVVKRSHIST